MRYRVEGLLPGEVDTVWMRSTKEEKQILTLEKHTPVYDIRRKNRDNGWWFYAVGFHGYFWSTQHPFGRMADPERGPMLLDDTPEEWRKRTERCDEILKIATQRFGANLGGQHHIDLVSDVLSHEKVRDLKIALALGGWS